MSVPGSSQRLWNRLDMRELAERLRNADSQQIELIKIDYEDVLYKTRVKLRTEFHYLVFDPRSGLEQDTELGDEHLQLLIGPDFKQRRRDYHDKPTDFIVDQPQCPVKDLSNVQPPFALAHFNILARGRNVRVRSLVDSNPVEIPPIVNLAIALSITACQQNRGLFLWQRKRRTTDAGHMSWQQVPDLLLLDYTWSPLRSAAFLPAPYAQKRDFLAAGGRLLSCDVVLPFVVDFPGVELEDTFDARVTADVDGDEPPKAAISIPGAGYIGWLNQFLPSSEQERRACYREEKTSEKMKTYRREYVVPPLKRAQIRATSIRDMYKRAMEMLENPAENSLMFYADVLRLTEKAATVESDGANESGD